MNNEVNELQQFTLFLLRHAKASHDGQYGDDHERPLTGRGVEDALTLGRFLKASAHRPPDAVLCSDALRTRQTAEYLFEGYGAAPAVEYRRTLYLASAGELLSQIQAYASASPERFQISGTLGGRGDPPSPSGLRRTGPRGSSAEASAKVEAYTAVREHGEPKADEAYGKNESVLMLIGHNPGLHQLIITLAGADRSGHGAILREKFPTAALAAIAFPDISSWKAIVPGAGILETLVTPSLLAEAE